MRLAVISDIHDNLANLKKCLGWCLNNQVEGLICCGDVANGETLEFLTEKIKIIYLVRGNMEIYDELEVKKYDNIEYLGRFGVAEIAGKTIGLCHEPWYVKSVLDIKPCQIVFYGHTHEPWIEEKGNYMIANPGTLGGVFNKASFAVWDSETKALELKILELI